MVNKHHYFTYSRNTIHLPTIFCTTSDTSTFSCS